METESFLTSDYRSFQTFGGIEERVDKIKKEKKIECEENNNAGVICFCLFRIHNKSILRRRNAVGTSVQSPKSERVETYFFDPVQKELRYLMDEKILIVNSEGKVSYERNYNDIIALDRKEGIYLFENGKP